MITPIDTRARTVAAIATIYAETLAFANEIGADPRHVLGDVASSEVRFQKWLRNSPDLRASLVANGWQT